MRTIADKVGSGGSVTIAMGAWAILAAFCTSVVWAQPGSEPIPWEQLSPQERRILEPLEGGWSQLPAERQDRLRRGAKRWSNMSPEQRRLAQERLRRWRQLPPDQRERIRKRFERFRQLSPQERRALREARRKFRSLPPERRRALRERFQQMTLEERRQFRRQLNRPRHDRQRPHGRPGGPERRRPSR